MWTYRVVKMDIEQAQVHRSLARPVLLGGGADRAPMIIRDNPVRHRTWTVFHNPNVLLAVSWLSASRNSSRHT